MFHSVAARVRERRYTNCVVVGCDSSVRGLSRLCNAHHIRRARHGSPTGRPILRSELKSYRKIVAAFARANDTHPALVDVHKELGNLLCSASEIVARRPSPRLKPRDWSARRCIELARLHAGATQGEEVFREVAAVWLMSRQQPRTLPAGKPLSFAVSRAVLSLRVQHNRLSTLMLQNLGEELLSRLALVLPAMANAIERGQQDTTRPVNPLPTNPLSTRTN